MSDESLWYLNAVFYELNVRAFFDSDADGNGDLRGLTQKLDYLKDLGVDAIWLLPIYWLGVVVETYSCQMLLAGSQVRIKVLEVAAA